MESNNYTHPCIGKDCLQCETCIYDAPLEDISSLKQNKVLTPNDLCNYCGYLIKQYKDKDVANTFNACCSKERIETRTNSRPRTIDFNLTDGVDIEKPEWCPKLKEAKKESAEAKPSMTYAEKRDILKNMPPHIDWSNIIPGKEYVIPPILGKKGKLLFLKYKTDFTLVCNEIKEDGTLSDFITNIFKTDIDANFIVEHKKF